MIIYTVTYYKKDNADSGMVYTSVFTTEEQQQQFIEELKNTGLNLVIESGFTPAKNTQQIAKACLNQFIEYYNS